MKLTKLELSGFKSFADTVTLDFGHGVTSIVGPNGCGKSNVSDAVRWVLGEQSARLLRGGKMEDVIFQGSSGRRPVNVVEVSLYLDNSAGDLPISYKEVVITRRLSRSGQSDYLLNKSPVRLRDIHDLIRGTGLGSDAGVVIEAKAIDRLLSRYLGGAVFSSPALLARLFSVPRDEVTRSLDRLARSGAVSPLSVIAGRTGRWVVST